MMVFHIFAPMYIKLLTFFQNKSTENKKFEKNWAKRQYSTSPLYLASFLTQQFAVVI